MPKTTDNVSPFLFEPHHHSVLQRFTAQVATALGLQVVIVKRQLASPVVKRLRNSADKSRSTPSCPSCLSSSFLLTVLYGFVCGVVCVFQGKEERDFDAAGFDFQFLTLARLLFMFIRDSYVYFYMFLNVFIILESSQNLHMAVEQQSQASGPQSLATPRLFSVPNPDVEPISDTMEAIFAGPAESPYEGGSFRLHIQVPPDYPFRRASLGG